MRKVQEVLRLLLVCGLSQRQVSQALGVGRASVADYVARVQKAGLLESWESLSGEELESRLYPPVRRSPAHQAERPEADWAAVHEELKRRDMTLSLVWQEYREQHPDGYQYSRFCDLYRGWRGKQDLCMRQVHRPGEKLFVDYCGATVPVVDAGTGEVREAQVFVAVWGASSYTFAEATWSQGLSDWIGSHVRAFEFSGGLPELVIPDNLRSGVTRACRYEPEQVQSFARDRCNGVGPIRGPACGGKSWASVRESASAFHRSSVGVSSLSSQGVGDVSVSSGKW